MESTTVEVRRWNPAMRVAFRFFFSYFCLFLIGNSPLIDLLPFHGFLAAGYTALWSAIVGWLESHLLHTGWDLYVVDGEAAISNTGFGTILFFCYLAIAAVAAGIWSALDRRRLQYERLHRIFRYLLRFSLALTMMHYGAIKVIPTQMIAPPLSELTRPLGDLTRMRLLWLSTGASPVYETLVGCAELLGGALLLIPRTTLLGGLICCANLTMVFILNMTYDVQVKLYSFHLLTMAALLVAPDLPRLADLFLFNRSAPPGRRWRLFAKPWRERSAQALLAVVCLYQTGVALQEAWKRYEKLHPPRPPFFGVWNVEELEVDGREVPPSAERWRRVTFWKPGRMGIENMIDQQESCKLTLDLKDRLLILEGPRQARFSIRPEEDEMMWEGTLDGHPARVKLRRMALLSKPFHWIFNVPEEDRELSRSPSARQ